jgi:hypothetical protein
LSKLVWRMTGISKTPWVDEECVNKNASTSLAMIDDLYGKRNGKVVSLAIRYFEGKLEVYRNVYGDTPLSIPPTSVVWPRVALTNLAT